MTSIDEPRSSVLQGSRFLDPEEHPIASHTNSPGTSGSRDADASKADADKPGKAFQAMSHASLGLEMGLCVLFGWGVGYWLDNKLDTAPYLMLLFLGCGIAAGFKALLRAARQAKSSLTESN